MTRDELVNAIVESNPQGAKRLGCGVILYTLIVFSLGVVIGGLLF